MNTFLKIAHRGASGTEPENTLRSFNKAISLKADMVELDVRKCKSGEIIVIHDKTIRRTTNGRGRVSNLSLPEIKKFNAGKGEKIPTLDEVLNLADKKIKINIELKEEDAVLGTVDVLKKNLKKGWKVDDFLISSFDRKTLKKFVLQLPKIPFAFLTKKLNKKLILWTKEVGCFSINCKYTSLSKKLVNFCHQQNIKIIAYTINKPGLIEKIKALGVDGIISNFPEKL